MYEKKISEHTRLHILVIILRAIRTISPVHQTNKLATPLFTSIFYTHAHTAVGKYLCLRFWSPLSVFYTRKSLFINTIQLNSQRAINSGMDAKISLSRVTVSAMQNTSSTLESDLGTRFSPGRKKYDRFLSRCAGYRSRAHTRYARTHSRKKHVVQGLGYLW